MNRYDIALKKIPSDSATVVAVVIEIKDKNNLMIQMRI